MKKRLLYCMIVVLGTFSALSADTSNALRFFRSQPVTLFDWGCYKVESALNSLKVEGIKSIVFVSEYDSEKNILSFGGLAFPKDELQLKGKRAEKEKLCITIMNKMREALLVDLRTGKCLFRSCMSGFFVSKSLDVPSLFYKDLDKICHLSITLKVGNDELLEYEGKLLGTSFNFN